MHNIYTKHNIYVYVAFIYHGVCISYHQLELSWSDELELFYVCNVQSFAILAGGRDK